MPVPASSGRPRDLTRPPNSPVLNAISTLRTAALNCGEAIICCKASGEGGTGRSGGKCGKRALTSSGCVLNNGAKLAGVRMSVREISVEEKNV